MTGALEFWPDYGGGPLWDDAGNVVAPHGLAIPAELADRLTDWNARYDEAHLPIEGPGDAAWLAEGRVLLAEVRDALRPVEVVATEPWWGEQPR
jgi:hypothetical protein